MFYLDNKLQKVNELLQQKYLELYKKKYKKDWKDNKTSAEIFEDTNLLEEYKQSNRQSYSYLKNGKREFWDIPILYDIFSKLFNEIIS